MKIRQLVLGLGLTALSLPAGSLADSIAPPSPWMMTTENGRFLFKMVPTVYHRADGEVQVKQEANAVVYEIKEDGSLEEFWRSEGWYARSGHLTEDGRYFVRDGLWACDQVAHNDLAVAFYDRGKLLKAYRVRELLRRPEAVSYTVSHYFWQAEEGILTWIKGLAGGRRWPQDNAFHLVCIDRTAYDFNLTTGEIERIATDDESPDWLQEVREDYWGSEEVREWLDAMPASQEEAERLGPELVEASPTVRRQFDDWFNITEPRVVRGWFGVSFAGNDVFWTASLTPKQARSSPVVVRPVLRVSRQRDVAGANSNQLKMSVSMEGLRAAIDGTLRHPLVVAFLNDQGGGSLEFRIRSDNLHWDSDLLSEWLAEANGGEASEQDLTPWVSCIVFAASGKRLHLYFNRQSQEVVYEEHYHRPILVDRHGERSGPSGQKP